MCGMQEKIQQLLRDLCDIDEVEVEVSSIRSLELGSEEVRAMCPMKLGLLTILTADLFLLFSELFSETLEHLTFNLFFFEEILESGEIIGRLLGTLMVQIRAASKLL